MGKEGGIGVLQGYEPFGSLLPGRNYNAGSYRNLFQGQEHDDEIYGATGTNYAFKYRMHDARVGRFWSLDPLASKYPYNSPYAFAENAVIQYVELEGLEKGVKQVRALPLLVPTPPNPNFLFEHVFPVLSNVRPVTSLREYGENVSRIGDNTTVSSLPLVLANPVLAETVANAGQTASVIGTLFQAAADAKDGNYTTATARVGLAVASYTLGAVSKKAVQDAGLPEAPTTFLNISNDILIGKAEGSAISAVGRSESATKSTAISSKSSNASTSPATTSPVVPTRTSGTDQIAP